VLLYAVESSGVRCLFILLLLLLLLLRYSLMKVFTWFSEPTDYFIIQKLCGKFVFVILKVIHSSKSEVVAVDV